MALEKHVQGEVEGRADLNSLRRLTAELNVPHNEKGAGLEEAGGRYTLGERGCQSLARGGNRQLQKRYFSINSTEKLPKLLAYNFNILHRSLTGVLGYMDWGRVGRSQGMFETSSD